jgi:hypothetical protein
MEISGWKESDSKMLDSVYKEKRWTADRGTLRHESWKELNLGRTWWGMDLLRTVRRDRAIVCTCWEHSYLVVFGRPLSYPSAIVYVV